MLDLTPELFNQIQQINSSVNRNRYVTDMDQYNVPEFWTEIDSAGGDCEDYALKKRRLLLDAGFPFDCLRIATCWDENGDYHAVLTVDTTQGTYVLDNRFSNVSSWVNLTQKGYIWDKRQGAGTRNWVQITR